MGMTTFEAAFRAIDTGRMAVHGSAETDLPLVRIEYSHHGQAEADGAPTAGTLVEWRGEPYYFWSDDLHGDHLTRTVQGVDSGSSVQESRTAPDRMAGVTARDGADRLRAIGGDPVAWVEVERIE
jgi:hypothetical protein